MDGEATRDTEAAHDALCDAEADRLALAAAREEVARANAVADSMQHFADVAEHVETRNNELAAEVAQMRAGIESVAEDLGGLEGVADERDMLLNLLAGDL